MSHSKRITVSRWTAETARGPKKVWSVEVDGVKVALHERTKAEAPAVEQ